MIGGDVNWWIDVIVNKALFPVVVTLFVLQLWVVVAHGGVPNLRTAPAIRKKSIELLKKDREARSLAFYRVVDLGAGNGLWARDIARAMPNAQVDGVELAQTSINWANWRKRVEKVPNVEFIKSDFYAYDFSKPDAFVMYQVPTQMAKLSKKLRDETRPGTLIICNKFPLENGWVPVDELAVKTLYPLQREVFVYRKV